MKKILYKVAASVCVALAATSCLDEALDVESQGFDESIVFSNYVLAEYNVFAIGDVIGTDQAYNARLDRSYGFNTDIEIYKNSIDKDGRDNQTTMSDYDISVSNGDMDGAKNGFVCIMQGLERANVCIQNLRKYANLSDPDMAYLLGESLTWRAFFYGELIKFHGEVPFRTTPVTSDDMYLPKSDRDIIYAQILADLEEAISLLYPAFGSSQTASTMRVSRDVACGLYARYALWAAGYSWRPDEGLVNTGNFGSLRTSTDPRFSGEGKAEMYKKALAYLEDYVINGNNNVALTSSFEQLWRDFCDDKHIYNNREVLWIRPYSDGRGRWMRTHGVTHKASVYISGAGGSQGGATGVVSTLWWKYGKNDTRRDVTCAPWLCEEDGFKFKSDLYMMYNGKYRFEWKITIPFAGATSDGVKPVVLRYADVLLMASELAYYLDETDKAKDYLLEVRRRAYAGNAGEADTFVSGLNMSGSGLADSADAAKNYYNKDNSFMKALIDERALEFAGEMLRKQDLIRWGLLKIKLDETKVELEHLAKMTDEFSAYGKAETVENRAGSNNKDATCDFYPIFWRVANNGYPEVGSRPLEIFGLEADEIGKTPEDYTELDPNGWTKTRYISTDAFWCKTAKNYVYDNGLYNNSLGDPWPRSVWPIFATPLNNYMGKIKNDYGYDQ